MVANTFDMVITADDLRGHMRMYVALETLSGAVPVFTTNRAIIEGDMRVLVVASESDPRWQEANGA